MTVMAKGMVPTELKRCTLVTLLPCSTHCPGYVGQPIIIVACDEAFAAVWVWFEYDGWTHNRLRLVDSHFGAMRLDMLDAAEQSAISTKLEDMGFAPLEEAE